MNRAGKFFYAALRYSMWSVGIVWIIFACHYGYAGKETIVNTIATYILFCCMVMFTNGHFLSFYLIGKYLPKTKDLNLLYIYCPA